MDFKGKNVLVVGCTGLIGRQLTRMLIEEEDAKVRGVSLDDRFCAHPNIQDFLQLDLAKFGNCLVACSGMDYVFNLLCLKGSPKFSKEHPATFFDSNTDLENNMIRATRRCGIRNYFLTSSIGVYPAAEIFFENDAANEKLPSKNDMAGGFAKLVAEIQAKHYMTEYGIKISVVRPANTYGPYDNFGSENAMVVPSLIKRVFDGEDPLVVWGDGSQIRDLIFSEDVARGMLHVAKLEETRPVNLGSGNGYSIKELVEVIVSNVEKKPEVVWDTTKPTGDKKRVLDTSRARSLLWSPKVSLEEGINKTMEWYRQNKLP